MKVTTLNNLKEFLDLMKITFGSKELATQHRSVIDTCLLNVDYTALNNDGVSATLGIGQLGTMILGKSS